MTTNTDFLALYQQLQLESGCSVAELKRAYRRRVAELHPDRQAIDAMTPANTELQELTATYAAAMAFARRHGRLPGASRQAGVRATPMSAPVNRAPTPGTAGAHPRRALLALAILAAVGWAFLPSNELIRSPDHGPAQDAAVAGARDGPQLTLGMSRQQVRAREGAPSTSSDRRWEYGTSWVAFENDQVSDWYSSPLHPLHVATRRAPNQAATAY